MSLMGMVWLDDRFADAGMPDTQGTCVATLGWRESDVPDEEGMSADVALLLSRLLLAHGEAIFIDHHLGLGDGARLRRRSAGGLLYSLPASRRWRYGPRGRALDVMATRDPTILATLALGAHAWPVQQQAILIAEDHGVLDRLEADAITGWLGARSRPDPRATFQDGVLTVLSAGHDGSFAGLHAPKKETLGALGDTLREICAEAGLDCHKASTSEEFRQLSGFGPRVQAS